MKKIFLALLVLAVSLVFAQSQKVTDKVKSKRGDVNLVAAAGGSQVVCTAGFNDEMTIIKRQESYALVKGSCGQGWVNNSDVERVVAGPGNIGFNMDAVDVSGWTDSRTAVFVLDVNAGSFEGINISRSFNDFLKNTVDREQTEMRNQEN